MISASRNSLTGSSRVGAAEVVAAGGERPLLIQADLYPDHPQRTHALLAPLPLRHGDAMTSLRTLATVLQTQPGITLVEQRPDYLYAQAQTRWLKFVDDLEFWFNPARGVIEVRSASRLGREDFAANRQRVEALRVAYSEAMKP